MMCEVDGCVIQRPRVRKEKKVPKKRGRVSPRRHEVRWVS